MAKKEFHKTLNENRSEEVAYIIEKMPTHFGFTVSVIVIGLFFLLLFFGWIIKYPEILNGQIVINTRQAPVKMIATTPGNIILLDKETGSVLESGEYIGYIKNEAKIQDVQLLDNLLKKINVSKVNYKKHRHFFPENLSLGDLNTKYFSFLNSLYQYLEYCQQQPYSVQKDINTKLLEMQKTTLLALENDSQNQKIKYKTAQSLFRKDSTLFTKDITCKADIERSIISKTNSELEYKAIDKQITNTGFQINEVKNKLQVITIEKEIKERELIISMFNNYHDLIDNIRKWEHTYVFIAPIKGKIDFLNFIRNNDFVESGQELFKIIPNKTEMIGQVNLPEHGAGKLKIGQDVVIKLDNYPYNEYGSIKGKVTSISLATNQQTLSSSQNKISSYLVNVSLPYGLKTNYGSVLDFHAEARGTAEIITEDRRLIERFFDNLKYKVK